ncbi:MAG: sulfur oxidation c-type cytochrome SoxX [Gammaproteobacteria bacterium]|nr:sulfur oxidation c-type cytochrome SoxX [Gammaproteobacteria bacterium]
MQTTTKFIGASALLLLVTTFTLPAAQAQGKAPTDQVCNDKANPPQDAVTKGGCVVINRTKGNCHACHAIAGTSSHGNIAPPLVSMKQRFPDKAKLRAQIWDATVANPRSVMSPFGRHKILSEQEIDQVVEFMLTL